MLKQIIKENNKDKIIPIRKMKWWLNKYNVVNNIIIKY